MCQPGLTVANCFLNGRKRLTEQISPSPQAWIVGSGIIHPDTNAPHWVQKAGFSRPFFSCAQSRCFMAGFCVSFA